MVNKFSIKLIFITLILSCFSSIVLGESPQINHPDNHSEQSQQADQYREEISQSDLLNAVIYSNLGIVNHTKEKLNQAL